jgi:hypothetical protein
MGANCEKKDKIKPLADLPASNNTIHCFQFQEGELFLKIKFLPSEENFTKVQSPSIYELFASIEKAGSIYIIGGKRVYPGGTKTYSAETLQINILNGQVSLKSELIKKRSLHSCCSTRSFIYAIAGEHSQSPLQSCERLNIEGNRWESIPSLSHNPQSITATAFGEKFIFAFGFGINTNKDVFNKTFIERYCVSLNQWKNIPFNAPASFHLEIPAFSSCLFDTNQIMIFGVAKKLCLTFNVLNGDVTPIGYLKYGDNLYQRNAHRFRDNVVLYDSLGNGVHIFNLYTSNWDYTQSRFTLKYTPISDQFQVIS